MRFRSLEGEPPTLWVAVTVAAYRWTSYAASPGLWLPYQIRDGEASVAVHLMHLAPVEDLDLARLRGALEYLAETQDGESPDLGPLAWLANVVVQHVAAGRGGEVDPLMERVWPDALRGEAGFRCALLDELGLEQAALEAANGQGLQVLLGVDAGCPVDGLR